MDSKRENPSNPSRFPLKAENSINVSNIIESTKDVGVRMSFNTFYRCGQIS